MSTVAQFAAKCEKYATVAPRAQRDALEQAALAVKESWIGDLRAVGLPGGGKLRNVGKSGAALTPHYKITGSVAEVSLPSYAAIVIGEGKTRPHVIGAKKLGTRSANQRRGLGIALGRTMAGVSSGGARGAFGSFRNIKSGAKALSMPDGNAVAYVFHPGSKRRDIFPAMVANAQKVATTTFKAAQGPALIRAGFGI